jgi:hypothetical protein
MSTPSCEVKLRNLAMLNAQMLADFGPSNAFRWFDRQLAQQGVAAPVTPVASNPVYMAVRRVSTQRVRNQGAVTALEAVRLELMIVSYSAENARQAANDVVGFMNSISLCSAGEFASPVTAPNQNPNSFLNERAGMLYELDPPAYTEMQDWRVMNRADIPTN